MSIWKKLFGINVEKELQKATETVELLEQHLPAELAMFKEKLLSPCEIDPKKDAFPPLPEGWNTVCSIIFLGYFSALQRDLSDDFLRVIKETSLITFQSEDVIIHHLASRVIPWVETVSNKEERLVPVAIMEHVAFSFRMEMFYLEELLVPCLERLATFGSVPDINKQPAEMCHVLIDGYKKKHAGGTT